ncbi:glycosyltransferase family 2 protein [Pseudoroseicyclus sp. CXY001]|uniref:glycosyltransferase family 2 protein n=1 Tax=Pseudoroseicyclus sp. CXY001 TaxID=3242492 RepID=UPI003570A879
MRHESLTACLAARPGILSRGPVAVILAEDAVEIGSTLAHHLGCGFAAVLLFADPGLALGDLPELADPRVERIDMGMAEGHAAPRAVNAVIAAAAPGTWLYYCYGAEYLFYPYSESRTVGEMLGFVAEERREAVLTYVVDLYAANLAAAPDAVSLEDAHLDRTGYYALARPDPGRHNHPMERQLDFFGGLRWRFEEHVPEAARRIDRIALFRARPGLRLLDGHLLSEPELNTYACPWHHSLTAAIASFRTAKALKTNPGSSGAIGDFRWKSSVPFDWHSRQLMDLGLMEPGQWF